MPPIKVLGRSVDLMDFEVPDEKGDFIGGRIYTRQINVSFSNISNIRWWEMYRLHGSPGKLIFFIIPENDFENEAAFRGKIYHGLNKADFFMSVAFTVKLVDVIITKPPAYKAVQKEIDKRVKEGRSLGQLKPKRIYSVDEEGLKEAYSKFGATP